MRHARHHHGFSFVEVMFSVVVLGIGCILIASIFPVAIQQTRSTADEAVAAQMARDAMQIITANTTTDQYPETGGTTRPFAAIPQLWEQVSSSVINQTDQRYAWVPLFSRGTSDSTVIITIVVVRRVLHGGYTPIDTSAGAGELVPRGIKIVTVTTQTDGNNTIEISRDGAGAYQSVAPDTFVVLTANGQILRIGEKKSESASSVTWALQPGSDPAAWTGSLYASVIGRDWVDPTDPASGFDGPAQDVAVYSSFLQPR